MTVINSTSLLSGLAVQQKYGTFELSGRTNREQTRTTVTPSGDTVEISSEAWEMFNAQRAGNTTGTGSAAEDDYETAAEEDTTGEVTEGFESRISVKEQIDQLESEISGLEGEIAALEERAETDELAAAVLRSKQARLQTLQAILTGLQAKSYEMG